MIEEEHLKKITELYYNHGFVSMTIEDIAVNLGVSKDIMYQNFNNKKEIIVACSKYSSKNGLFSFRELSASSENSIQQFLAYRHLLKEKLVLETYRKNLLGLKKHYPNTYQEVQNIEIETGETIIKEVLQAGIKQGLIDENKVTESTIKIFASTYRHYLLGDTENKEINFEVMENYFLYVFLSGLVTEKGREYLESKQSQYFDLTGE